MKLSRDEKNLLRFLAKYPNQWHEYASDKRTVRALGYLLLVDGLGVTGLEVSRETNQMRLNGDQSSIDRIKGMLLNFFTEFA